MASIEVKDLYYKYPSEEKWTIKGLNLKVSQGDFILILGESGSSKSTLAKILTGSAPNFYGGTIGGEVLFNGKSLNNMTHKERAEAITMVFQDPEKQIVMNKVHREIALGLENIGIPSDEIKRRVFESLQFLNILDLWSRDIETLSGGQKQKVAIASALSYTPSCIILDEPTSQLDPASSEETLNILKKINSELGITIIVIEQRIGRWFDEVDKIGLMKEGSLVYFGDRGEYYKQSDSYLQDFLPAYLKLFKILGQKEAPKDFRASRRVLEENLHWFKLREESLRESKASEVALSIEKLEVKYDDFKVLKDINLTINKGDFTCILGANGAGKSTLLKSIMGLLPFKGNIRIFNEDIKKINRGNLGKTVGFVSQNPNDYITRDTVYEELKFTLDNYKIKDNGEINKILEKLKLMEYKDKNPRDLSGGQRQRVAIASILVLKPEILILDEPTRGMDPQALTALGDILIDLQKEGTTIILVTHDIEFAASFGKSFCLMFNGEITTTGYISKVLKNGIYYTTAINKLFRNTSYDIYSLKQAEGLIKHEE